VSPFVGAEFRVALREIPETVPQHSAARRCYQAILTIQTPRLVLSPKCLDIDRSRIGPVGLASIGDEHDADQ